MALIDKKNAYDRIHPIPICEAKAWEAAQKAKEQAPAETPEEVEPGKRDIYEPTEI